MAIVAAYNFDALLDSGLVPDMAGYSRDLTLDPGVGLTVGRDRKALDCTAGGASRPFVVQDYIVSGASWSCFAWVNPAHATATERVIAQFRSSEGLRRAFLLSDASGFLAVRMGINGSDLRSSGVSVLDGDPHMVGVSYDGLNDGNVRFWVDGVLVATVSYGVASWSERAGTFSVGRGDTATDRIVGAVVDDLRWFNDPVYPGEAAYFQGSVTNMVVAAYNFDAGTGTLVADQTLRGNDLTLTGNGAWVAGVNGTAIGPVATGSPAAEGAALDLGDFDRLTIVAHVQITATGSAAPFLSLEAADGSPRMQLFRGGSLGLLMKAWGDDPGTYPFLSGDYLFGADGVLSTSGWRWFIVNVNPTGWVIRVYDGDTLLDAQSPTYGTPPTNAPLVTGITRLRVSGAAGAGGIAKLDNLRVIRNYLNPYAADSLRNTPVQQEPSGLAQYAVAGTIPATSSTVGAVAVRRAMVGAVQGVTGAAGAVTSTQRIAGQVSAETATAGAVTARLTTGGTVTAVTTVTGDATVDDGPTSHPMSGEVRALATAAGSVTARHRVAGVVAAVSAVFGRLTPAGDDDSELILGRGPYGHPFQAGSPRGNQLTVSSPRR